MSPFLYPPLHTVIWLYSSFSCGSPLVSTAAAVTVAHSSLQVNATHAYATMCFSSFLLVFVACSDLPFSFMQILLSLSASSISSIHYYYCYYYY